MNKKAGRKNIRQRNFIIVARGVRRIEPDFSRLMQATLDQYLALTRAQQSDDRRSSVEGDPR